MVRKVGKYELGKTIGEGAYSKVKYAIDTETGRRVAIKIMDQNRLKELNMMDKVRREITIMKSIHHPNVVNLLDVLVSKTNVYIVLELVTGGELFAKLANEERFDEETTKAYFWQLICGVEHCHERGIAHRDLKPENILLDENNTLKITDFGLSALHSNEGGKKRVLMTAVGTPQYVAPEVLAERGYDGCAADMWSLGVILYVFLTGTLPFSDATTEGLYKKIANGWYPVPPTLSDGAKDLLSKLLVVDPTKRATMSVIKSHQWLADAPQLVKQLPAAEPAHISSSSSEDDAFKVIDDEEEQKVAAKDAKTTFSAIGGLAVSNAFELISLAGALDLSRLLQPGKTLRKHYTRFITKSDPKTLLERMRVALEEKMKYAGCKVFENSGKIKVTARTPMGIVMIQIQVLVLMHPQGGESGLQLVDVRRTKGDTLEFNAIFRQLKHEVADLIPENKNRGKPPPVSPRFRSSTDGKLPKLTRQESQSSREVSPNKDERPNKSPIRNSGRSELSASLTRLPTFLSNLIDNEPKETEEKRREREEKEEQKRKEKEERQRRTPLKGSQSAKELPRKKEGSHLAQSALLSPTRADRTSDNPLSKSGDTPRNENPM